MSVFDLDGTILNRDLRISDRTFTALQRLREKGLRVVIATGRRYESAREHAARLGFSGDDPIICYGGSMVRRMNGETLLHHTLEPALAVEALEWAAGRGLAARVFLDNSIVVSAGTPEAFGHVRMSGEPEVLTVESPVDWLRERGLDDEEPTKIVVVDEPEEIDGWLEEARAVFEGRLFVTRSLPHYVEISTPNGTKSNALESVCGWWGVEPSRVLAFGDADNDIDMLRFAGHGVAVGGMNDEVRAAADALTSPVDEDGVAVYIEKIMGDL